MDPRNTYELKGFFKSEGAAKTAVLFGLLLADSEKRDIMSWNRFSVKGTRTELLAACSPGANVLKVKDATGWKTGPSYAVSFGKEENALNFDVSPLGVKKVQPEKVGWKIVLEKPCGLAFPAGTPIAENTAGGNGIFLGGDVAGEWTEIKGTIGPKQWWPGVKYVSVYIQPKLEGEKSVLLMDDLVLTPISPALPRK